MGGARCIEPGPTGPTFANLTSQTHLPDRTPLGHIDSHPRATHRLQGHGEREHWRGGQDGIG